MSDIKMLETTKSYEVKNPGEQPVQREHGQVLEKGNVYYIKILRETKDWVCYQTVSFLGGTKGEAWLPKSAFKLEKREE